MAFVASIIDSDVRATAAAVRATPLEGSDADEHLRACVSAHLGAVWRMLRRNGVPAADADDAAQKVFLVLSRKRKSVPPGRELQFLLRTAVLVASEARRAQRRRREVSDPSLGTHASSKPSPEHELLQRERLSQLDAVLSEMDESLRVAFVLYELEEMTMAAIAETLELPPGTVASRLRRARQRFEELAEVVRDESGGER
jgi:RNA polymerase sigma-70 factor (ECF subfamily)